jgi:hypothetical protein
MRFTALVIAAFVFSLPSWVRTEAAQVRSAEDIAKDLKPNDAMLGRPTRGIRPAAPGTGNARNHTGLPCPP